MHEKPRPFDAPEQHLAAFFREREASKLRARLAADRTIRLRFGTAR